MIHLKLPRTMVAHAQVTKLSVDRCKFKNTNLLAIIEQLRLLDRLLKCYHLAVWLF